MNDKILQEIENLKGRRAYVEKKAAKLGFVSLYAYIEHKLQNTTLTSKKNAVQSELFRHRKKLAKKATAEKKKSCGCC